MTPFGVRLRQLRAERGIRLKDMAEALGVSAAYLSALEHGRRGRPTHAIVVAICAHIEGMVGAIERGANPFDWWAPDWSLGFPVLRNYQPLAHAIVVAICAHLGIIWDDADELMRLARVSHPRVTVDTAGLSAEATELANLLAERIRKLPPERVKRLLDLLKALPSESPTRRRKTVNAR